MELISVHMPKCAGTSFFRSLEQGYGAERVLSDYGDGPMNPGSPMNLDPVGFFAKWNSSGYPHLAGKDVVHGHFHVNKYAALDNVLRITFLRHPIDRLLSHYFYWQDKPYNKTHPPFVTIRSHLIESKLTPLQFMQMPALRYFYTCMFFGGVDMECFDFIGFHDTMADDMARLSRLLGRPLDVYRENPTTHGEYSARREAYLADADFMRQAQAIMADDIAFYDRLRERG